MIASDKSSGTLPEVQLAAGGIVWRRIDGVPKIAVIHRPKYDDWTLPKGKPDANETLAETARREVREELGCDVVFRDFAGTIHYPHGVEKTKLVLYWHMLPSGESRFQPNDEVDEVLWLSIEEAMRKLDHPIERELLGRCIPPD